MIAGHIDDEYLLDFRANRTDPGGVNKVDGKPKAFESGALKEITIPQLGVG